jgi:hypothetical protein
MRRLRITESCFYFNNVKRLCLWRLKAGNTRVQESFMKVYLVTPQ